MFYLYQHFSKVTPGLQMQILQVISVLTNKKQSTASIPLYAHFIGCLTTNTSA